MLRCLLVLALALALGEAFAPVGRCSVRRLATFRSNFGDEFGRSTPAKPTGATAADSVNKVEDELAAPGADAVEERETERKFSSAMIDKMGRETDALGGNPNAKSANPIVIVSGVIALLAVLAFLTGSIQ